MKATLKISIFFLCLCFFYWLSFYGLDTGIHLSQSLEKPSFSDLFGKDVMGRSVLGRCLQAFYHIVLPSWLVGVVLFFIGVLVAYILFPLKQKSYASFVLNKFDQFVFLLSTCPAFLLAIAFSIFFEKVQTQSFLLICGIICFVHGYFEVIYLYKRDHLLGYWQMNEIQGGSIQHRVLSYGLLSHWKKALTERLVALLRLCFLLEVCLSYLGFGIPEPYPSFGNMLASHFNLLFSASWHPLLQIAFLFIGMLLLPTFSLRFLIKN